jgi:hypothetical protein
MSTFLKIATAAAFCAGILFAQTESPSKEKSNYAGQTWVGLLVADACRTAPRSGAAAMAEAERLSPTDRVTTPAVDEAGSRGSATTERKRNVENAVPRTGDVNSKKPEAESDSGWKQARRQAASLDASCRVNSGVRKFALLLADGSMLRFDDLGDSKIAAQIQANGRLGGRGNIFRVQVTGKLQDGAIALDNLQL